ncbi:MAG: ankyrin repeat protein [Limisphaerales bacterium]|nr:MAG: ankyrin repeat protein [Limisphaerales bacterium]KAG0507698.1 MAG: ankyrin repeat protein [Limisphaerales bacterium]TXT52430.1 MAG: ankyrin repeat protein [Limisphaerales bacterium]
MKALTDRKPTRKLWLLSAVIAGLLALTTWDVLRNSSGSSPAALRRAAFEGDEATVRRLIAAHPQWINSVGSTNGRTSALTSHFTKIKRELGLTTSSRASGDREGLFRELEGAGSTPLFNAMAARHVGLAMTLIESGADPSVKLARGWPLVFAAAQIGDTNLMTAMMKRGVRLDVLEPGSGMTILHNAAFSQKPEMLSFLIAHGLSVNATNYRGVTPLDIAIGRSKLDLVQVLATNGADLEPNPARGYDALEAARRQASSKTDPNATAVVTWLEAFIATNQPTAKPAP